MHSLVLSILRVVGILLQGHNGIIKDPGLSSVQRFWSSPSGNELMNRSYRYYVNNAMLASWIQTSITFHIHSHTHTLSLSRQALSTELKYFSHQETNNKQRTINTGKGYHAAINPAKAAMATPPTSSLKPAFVVTCCG